MEAFSAQIHVNKGKSSWSIPITIDVSFRQTFRETLEEPADYEVNDYFFKGIGHVHEHRECPLVEKLVEDELYNNDLQNVELL